MKGKKRSKQVTVGFVALGCPKNVVDSERMLAEIAEAGFLIAADADSADVVIVNTCGFIAPAKAEALEAIKHAVDRKAAGAVKKVIVAGCLAQRMGEELFSEAGDIDAIVGLGERDRIAEIIKKTIGSDKHASFLDCPAHPVSDDRARLLITPGHMAYLRISEGCDHKCAFCTIPAIRGRFRSKAEDVVLAEATELADAGVVELNVIAQDTANYGRDLKIKDGLAGLVEELEKIDGVRWIRLMYLYPAGISKRLIETVAKSEKILHYFDIPIQHISDEILRAMKRPDSKERICKLIEDIKKAIPDAVLRTTIIVGLPGETEKHFAELLEFVKWAEFGALGCFKYCPEDGTAAAEMGGQVAEEIKQKRYDELMLAQQEIAFSKNQARVGTALQCLVESVEEGGDGYGRYYGQAAEIDSVCIIKDCSAKAGQFIEVKVVGCHDYDLIVEEI